MKVLKDVPYRTGAIQPMTEVTRDLLLIAVASLAEALAETKYGRHQPEFKPIKELIREARKEMGFP